MRNLYLLRAALLPVFTIAAVLASNYSHAETLLSQNVMATPPSTPNISEFSLASAGTLTVTVSDLDWPQLLQSLSFAITDNAGVLETLSNFGGKNGTDPGTLDYKTTGPMTLFADVYAVPNAIAGTGLYHINVAFVPAVPLPAAGWLLLSGMAGLVSLKRKVALAHATVTNSVVQ